MIISAIKFKVTGLYEFNFINITKKDSTNTYATTGYVLVESFLVIFIKLNSIDGITSYNPVTLNLIAEIIKLIIALSISKTEGSLYSLRNVDFKLFICFAVPNLMYAVNNNLYHYSIGLLPPAVFIVTINIFRIILTGLLQPLVSNQPLSKYQILACIFLFSGFIFTSLPEIIRAAFNNVLSSSMFTSLIYLSSIFSVVSVSASLTQEKLLKNSKSVMAANVLNYSIGVIFQIAGLIYFKNSYPDLSLVRGLNNFWVQLIPILMAFSGLSVSLILRHSDNIIKLVCSSFSLLLFNTGTYFFGGVGSCNISVILGWFLTILATFTYSKKVNVGINSIDERNNKAQTTEQNKKSISFVIYPVIFVSVFLFISILNSSLELKIIDSPQLVTDSECKIFEGSEEKAKNLREVRSFDSNYNIQFAWINNEDGNIYVMCKSKLSIIGPETTSYKKSHSNYDEVLVY